LAFLDFLGKLGLYVDLAHLKMIFGRILGTGRFLDTISGHRIINFYWKLCTRIYNLLFCYFILLGLQFQVTFQKDQKFRKVGLWSELYPFYV